MTVDAQKKHDMTEEKYYIVSLKHMHRHDQILVLWGPNFSGYTGDVDKAGKYTAEEVRAAYGNRQDFPIITRVGDWIDNDCNNCLIPADNPEALEKLCFKKMAVITYA